MYQNKIKIYKKSIVTKAEKLPEQEINYKYNYEGKLTSINKYSYYQGNIWSSVTTLYKNGKIDHIIQAMEGTYSVYYYKYYE